MHCDVIPCAVMVVLCHGGCVIAQVGLDIER